MNLDRVGFGRLENPICHQNGRERWKAECFEFDLGYFVPDLVHFEMVNWELLVRSRKIGNCKCFLGQLGFLKLDSEPCFGNFDIFLKTECWFLWRYLSFER